MRNEPIQSTADVSRLYEEPHLRAEQFVRFTQLVAITTGLIGGSEILLGIATPSRPLSLLGALTLAIAVIALIARQLTRSGRLPAGMYTWAVGSSLTVGLLPLMSIGTMPLVLANAAINILLVALFLSPRLIGRIGLILAILVVLSTAFESWAPGPRLNLTTDSPYVSLVTYPMSISFIAFLTKLLGDTLLRALASARAHAERLRQSEASLLERTEELEKLNRNWQITSQQAERRATYLAASVQVARKASQVHDLDQLLPEVTHLISQAFGYYHVDLFLLDKTGRFLELRAANSEEGQRMLKRGYKLALEAQNAVGYAASTGQYRVEADTARADAVHAYPQDAVRELALPLRVGEQIFGVLDICTVSCGQTGEADAERPSDAPPFTEEEITTLSTLADQIAITIQSANLFQQTQAAFKELETASQMMMREGWQGYLGRPATTRQAEFRAASAPATSPLSRPLTIPLEFRQQPMGKLTLRREGAHAWSEDEIEMVQAIAFQTMLAADNARLVEQTQRTLREAEGLYNAAQAVTSATEIEEICHILAQQVGDLVQADRTLVFLVDHHQKQILLRAGSGNVEDSDLGTSLETTYEELSSGISGQVFKSGQPILSTSADDGIEPEETRLRREPLPRGLGALMVVPLVVRGEVIGTTTAINRIEQRAFTPRDVELLRALAAQAATAIENRRLLEETQRRAEREQLIRQITTRIRAADEIQEVLEITATDLARSLGVPRAIVRLATDVKRDA